LNPGLNPGSRVLTTVLLSSVAKYRNFDYKCKIFLKKLDVKKFCLSKAPELWWGIWTNLIFSNLIKIIVLYPLYD
jgi:hypothetical protein